MRSQKDFKVNHLSAGDALQEFLDFNEWTMSRLKEATGLPLSRIRSIIYTFAPITAEEANIFGRVTNMNFKQYLNNDMSSELIERIYKENPPARFINIKNGVALYAATQWDGPLLMFQIPITEMGETSFDARMGAQSLIRWLQLPKIDFQEVRNK